jgi:hypothetical protein
MRRGGFRRLYFLSLYSYLSSWMVSLCQVCENFIVVGMNILGGFGSGLGA